MKTYLTDMGEVMMSYMPQGKVTHSAEFECGQRGMRIRKSVMLVSRQLSGSVSAQCEPLCGVSRACAKDSAILAR